MANRNSRTPYGPPVAYLYRPKPRPLWDPPSALAGLGVGILFGLLVGLSLAARLHGGLP